MERGLIYSPTLSLPKAPLNGVSKFFHVKFDVIFGISTIENPLIDISPDLFDVRLSPHRAPPDCATKSKIIKDRGSTCGKESVY